MTSRERLLCLLAGDMPDRVPVAPFIQEEFLSWYFGKNDTCRVADVCEMADQLGFDVITKQHMSTPYFLLKNFPNWQVDRKFVTEGGNYLKVTTITTPKKTFHQVEGVPYSENYQEGLHFITTEFMIKNQEDFEIFRQYMPPMDDESKRDIIEKAKWSNNLIGQRGVSAPWSYGSVFNLACTFMNIEDILAEALIEPEYYEEYMGFFRDILKADLEIFAQSEFDIIGMQGNMANASLMGSTHFEDYVLPFENSAIEPLTQSGKPLLYHNCGCAKSLYEPYRKLNMRILETISEPPQGDATLQYAKQFFADSDLIICGTFDQVNFLKQCTPQQAFDAAREKVEIGKSGGKYIFAASDYIEYGTSIDNVKAMINGALDAAQY